MAINNESRAVCYLGARAVWENGIATSLLVGLLARASALDAHDLAAHGREHLARRHVRVSQRAPVDHDNCRAGALSGRLAMPRLSPASSEETSAVGSACSSTLASRRALVYLWISPMYSAFTPPL